MYTNLHFQVVQQYQQNTSLPQCGLHIAMGSPWKCQQLPRGEAASASSRCGQRGNWYARLNGYCYKFGMCLPSGLQTGGSDPCTEHASKQGLPAAAMMGREGQPSQMMRPSADDASWYRVRQPHRRAHRQGLRCSIPLGSLGKCVKENREPNYPYPCVAHVCVQCNVDAHYGLAL